MGISSSLNAGVSGLNAQANKLATISDNIANSSDLRLQAGGRRLLLDDGQRLEVARTPSAAGAGSPPAACGPMRSGTSTQQGALTTTSNATDLAITGRGFLPVTTSLSIGQATRGDLPFMLTTTGSFTTDNDGYLRTSSGLVLMGWPADHNGDIPGSRATPPIGPRAGADQPLVLRDGADRQRSSSTSTCRPTSQGRRQRRRAHRHHPVLRQRRRVADAGRELHPDGAGDRPPQTTPGRSTSPTRPSGLARHRHADASATCRRTPAAVSASFTGGLRRLTSYDSATGNLALDLGNARRSPSAIGSTDRRSAST